MDRFLSFDVTLGHPYQELVGSLLWIVLCVMGPELVRVKDLARRSNKSTPSDYQEAFKVLQRIYKRRDVVIRFQRGSAGKEWIPSATRPPSTSSEVVPDIPRYMDDDLSCFPSLPNDPLQSFDISEVLLPTNPRFSQVAFSDAAFAVGDLKMSITGLIVYVNCTPIIWTSEKQSTVADSTCSSEFVGASVCAKQLMHVENIVFHASTGNPELTYNRMVI